MTSWIRIYINVVIVSWCLWTGSLMIISLLIFSHHEKCCYLIYKGIKRADLEVTLWRQRSRHRHDKYFFSIIWDELFISEVKLKLCLIFQNFQNDRHFELTTNFFTGSDTGSWISQKDSHYRYSNIKIWPIWWPGDVIHDVMHN